ncbi:MAG: NPCBM/NEW2 domain-containing protein [Cytophagales bacterium]|nr:NPCBM/NEW2 domain-containing protein [Cytophagales bacterium]
MRNLNKRKHLAVLLAVLCLTLKVRAQSDIVTFPAQGSVFQRSSSNTHTFYFAGQLQNSNQMFYRIDKLNTSNNNWSTVTMDNSISTTWTNQDRKGFYVNAGNLSTGWYRVRIYRKYKVWVFFNKRVYKDAKEFGVGDVYFVAGQSNAAGYIGYPPNTSNTDDDNTDAYFTPSGGISPLVRGINSTGLSDVPGEEQQFEDLSGFASPNGKLNLGIPNKGFDHLVSGSNNTTNRKPIYPNGGASWCWPAFGNLFAQNGIPTLIFNSAIPGASIATTNSPSWAPGQVHRDKLLKTLRTYGNIFGAKAVLWHQGERDAQLLTQTAFGGNSTSRSAFLNVYQNNVNSLITDSRNMLADNSNKNLAWYISRVGYTTGEFNDWTGSFGIGPYRAQSAGFESPHLPNVAGMLREISHDLNFSNYYDLNDAQRLLQNSGNRVFLGALSDQIGSDLNSDGLIDSEEKRASNWRIHFSGNSLGDLANKWKDAIDAANNNSSVTAKALVGLSSVTNNGSNYTLTVPSQGSGTLYYWTKNEKGMFDPSAVQTSSPNHTFNNTNGNDFLRCYILHADGRVSTVPPFCVPGGANDQKILNAQDLSYTSASESKTSIVTAQNVDWDVISKPSWINTINFDEDNSSLSVTSDANSGNTRSGKIRLEELGNPSFFKEINVVQTGTSCSPTNLSSLPIASYTQDWGTPVNNLNVSGNTMEVSGFSYSNGIGTHAHSTINYDLSPYNFTTLNGSVGRDDDADNCNCGTQKIQFQIRNQNDNVLWTSNLLGPNDNVQNIPSNLNIAGVTQLKLVALDGGDNNWGDYGDWVNMVLSCGGGCNVSPPNAISATVNPVTPSNPSSVLSTSCAGGATVRWNTGQSGNQITVSPTSNQTYSAYCDAGSGCTSSNVQITILYNTNLPSCSNTYLGNNWISGSAGWNAPPKINTDVTGGSLNINNVTYGNGIGTHAFSEIIYDLGTSHNFQSFKADVGRDQDAYGCNCGAQDITFKVVNNANNAVLAGPITKGNWQSATSLTANLSGVRYLKLVVDNGSDGLNYGDYANWANARLVCTSSSRIGEVRKEVLEEPETKEIKVIPNPVEGDFKVQFYAEESKLVEIEIYNGSGRLMKNSSGNVEPGENTFSLSSEGLSPGQYIIRVLDGIGVKTKKVVVK